MPQRIGISAVFSTAGFNQGLQRYVNGLNRAINATTMAAAAIQQQASGMNNVLGGAQFQQGVAAYNNGLTNAVANTRAAAQAIAGAIRGIPNLPGGPRAAGAAGGGGGTPAVPSTVVGGRNAAEDLRVAELLQQEAKDMVALEKTRKTIADQTVSVHQKLLATLEAEVIAARQVVRQQELANLGVPRGPVQAIANTPTGPSRVQADLKITQLMQEELRDLVVLEKTRQTFLDSTSTKLQKQLALMENQAALSRRAQRGQELLSLGVSQAQIDKLRSVPVVMRDIEAQSRRAAASMQQLNARTIALGVAMGQLAVSASKALVAGLNNLAKSAVQNVTFFESLGLSIEFYAVRSLRAEGIITDFATGLKLVRKEAEGTLIWLQRLAVESPFTTKDVGTLFRTSQAYGLLRKEAIILTPLLLDFAAAAGLSEEILERLALAIGQVRARGKLTGEEVRQLGNSGIPIRDILVKELGILNSEFDELVEKGQLTSDIVIPAIIKSLEDFRGAGKRIQFETIGGIISAFKELAQFSSFRFFEGVIDPIKEQLLELFGVLNNNNVLARITAIGEAIGRGLATALRALSIAISVTIKAWQALDPVIKRQVILFGLSVVAVLALAAALGLLTLALKLITSRLVLIVAGVALFVTAWTTGFQSIIDIAISTGNVIGAVFGGISKFFSQFFQSLGKTSAAKEGGRTIGDDLNAGFRETGGKIKKEITKEVDSVTGDALIAGSEAGAAFLRGWKIPNPAKTISKELQKALDAFGSGPQLSIAGAEAVNKFFEPFKSIDLSFFDDVSGTIRTSLQNAVDLGDIKDKDLPALLFGGRKAVAEAINEFRRIGSISARTLNAVRNNAGTAGNAIVGFLGVFTRLATATDVVEATQKRLNDITFKYKEIIEPIRKELEKISELRRQSDENEEILALQRTLNNEAVSGARKRTAQLRIDEIRAGQRLRGLETERDAQTELENDRLSAAQKIQEELQKELDLLKARFSTQQDQLGLVGDEASIFRNLQEEINKLREKEKTDLEKQLEFLGLINEALGDAKKVAEAKFILASGETTEFEKQQALLTLQTVEFERQQRALKATELGFDPAILKQLEDVPIRLSDIGEKFDAASKFDTVNNLAKDLGITLPDFVKFAEDWNKELVKARDWWLEIQKEITNTATLINDSLPSFAKIFPEQPGGKPPILENINGLTLAIAGLVVFAPQILGIIGILGKLAGAIGSIAAAGSGAAAAGAGAGAAAAGAGAGAGAGGALATTAAVVGRTTIVGRILGFLGPIGLIAGAALAVKKEIDDSRDNLQASVTSLETVLSPEASQRITESATNFISGVGLEGFDVPGQGKQFEEALAGTIVSALESGQSKEQVSAAVQAFVVSAIPMSDLPAIQEQITAFTTEIGTLLETNLAAATTTGFSSVSVDPTIVQEMNTIFGDALSAGFSAEDGARIVAANMNTAVAQGFIADTPENQQAIALFVQSLLDMTNAAAESNSPSELFRREVGVPIGEGILLGIADVSGSVDNSPELKKIMKAIAAPFETAGEQSLAALVQLKKDADTQLSAMVLSLSTKYRLFFADITLQMTTFRDDHRETWIGIRLDALTEVTTLREEASLLFDALRLDISGLMDAIYKLIITDGFKKINTDAQVEIAALSNTILTGLVTGENSVLAQLNKLIGGTEKESRAWNIGKSLITGIAAGITDNVSSIVTAMKAAIAEVFSAVSEEYQIDSPSKIAASALGLPLSQGVAKGVTEGIPQIMASMKSALGGALAPSNFFPARAGGYQPQSVSNVSRTTNYHLNVNSTQASQGIIGDYTVMQVMGNY